MMDTIQQANHDVDPSLIATALIVTMYIRQTRVWAANLHSITTSIHQAIWGVEPSSLTESQCTTGKVRYGPIPTHRQPMCSSQPGMWSHLHSLTANIQQSTWDVGHPHSLMANVQPPNPGAGRECCCLFV